MNAQLDMVADFSHIFVMSLAKTRQMARFHAARCRDVTLAYIEMLACYRAMKLT